MQHGVKILMSLFSGGKSIHSWVDLRGLSAEQREKLYAYVAAIGADTKMFTICQAHIRLVPSMGLQYGPMS